MDWDRVEGVLARSFRAKAERFGRATVIVRRRPLSLGSLVERTFTADEVEEWGDLESWPGSVSQLLEGEAAEVPLLGFYWESFGPMSSVAGIVLVGTRRRRYLCVWDEISSYRAVAAVEPWDDPLAVSAAVSTYLAVNGRRHGDWLLGSLPHEVTNHRPDLVPTPVVKQALFDYMLWAERVDPGAWSLFAQEHYGRIVEPNHLQRSLDLIQTIPWGDDGAWLDELERESAAMPDHARQRLFDEWFATAYEARRIHHS